jgi:hypothetical protein
VAKRRLKRKKKHRPYKPYKPKDVEAYRKRKREYARRPEQRAKANERKRLWRKKHGRKEIQRARELRNTKEGKIRSRRHSLKKHYGITPEQYDKILQLQNGVCAICDQFSPRSGTNNMPVDHCHTTLKVRGILCHACNTRLGWYEARRKRICEYLENVAQVLELLK